MSTTTAPARASEATSDARDCNCYDWYVDFNSRLVELKETYKLKTRDEWRCKKTRIRWRTMYLSATGRGRRLYGRHLKITSRWRRGQLEISLYEVKETYCTLRREYMLDTYGARAASMAREQREKLLAEHAPDEFYFSRVKSLTSDELALFLRHNIGDDWRRAHETMTR